MDVVRDWPLPKTVAEVRGSIGLCWFQYTPGEVVSETLERLLATHP